MFGLISRAAGRFYSNEMAQHFGFLWKINCRCPTTFNLRSNFSTGPGNSAFSAKLRTENTTSDAKSRSNSNHAVHVPRENLAQLAEKLKQQIPYSLNVLGAVKCTELGEVDYDFYVDRWPDVDLCIGVIHKEHFRRFKNQPYSIVNFFGRHDDRDTITQFVKDVIPDWRLPMLFLPGPDAEQIATMADISSAHGTMLNHDKIFHMPFTTNKDDIEVEPLPSDYERIRLTTDHTDEIAGNWSQTNAPFKIDDLRTLLERFPFSGVRFKGNDALVAHCGQLHNGSCGVGWVHPEHRGNKLFQATISPVLVDIIKRYGFVFDTVIDGNDASLEAQSSIGLRGKDGHHVHWGQFIPHGMPLPPSPSKKK